MKILCFIDSLGSGGAQRQLVALGVGLKRRGHDVRFLMYHDDDHFLDMLKAYNITYNVIGVSSYIQRVFEVRKILRRGWQDVVLAFLEAPALYAEIASIPDRKWGLVVGERLANPNMKNIVGLLLRQFHRLADVVVSNSHTNRLMLKVLFPFLNQKSFTIYNVVDLERFSDKEEEDGVGGSDYLSIVVFASYQRKKNMLNLAKAMNLVAKMNIDKRIVINWYGAMPAGPSAYEEVRQYIERKGLERVLYLHSSVKNVEKEMRKADVVGLFSFYEGLPNVICEGMACGKPILLSEVCDASNLVKDGINGYLCNPYSPEDMAEKIVRMATLNPDDRRQMGRESRLMSESLFKEEVVLERYEKIIMGSFVSKELNWPPDVPASASVTVEHWCKR